MVQEFPLWHSGLMIWLVSVAVWVRSLAQNSGLRIWHFLSCGVGRTCGTGSSPDPGISTCQGYGQKRKKTYVKLSYSEKSRKYLKLEWISFLSHNLHPWDSALISRVSWKKTFLQSQQTPNLSKISALWPENSERFGLIEPTFFLMVSLVGTVHFWLCQVF